MAHLLADDSAMTVYVGCPELMGEREGKALLADFYGRLLGWPRYDAYGTPFLSRTPKFRIGFDGDGWSDLRPPRWPDPDHPQQLHFDFTVPDLGATDAQIIDAGGTLLQDDGGHRIYADPVGHPLCLYPDPADASNDPTVARLVYDCFSPRSLAVFYQGLLGVQERPIDSSELVEIDLDDADLPKLAFQHAQAMAPRWPDPAYPAQLHVDYRFSFDPDVPHFRTPAARAAIERVVRLGGIHLHGVTYADPAGHPFCF